MKIFYQIAGVSKQAHQQYMHRMSSKKDKTQYYIGLIEQARQMHPVIGLAKIYYLFQPAGIGRDSFIQIGSLAGYALESKLKTTWKGARIVPYENLLKQKLLNGINQVWATDITYYRIKETYYYISMILDLYSRRIVACGVAETLHAYHSVKLLKKAISNRKPAKNNQLIHHSDKGVQYTCDDYTKLLKKHHIGIRYVLLCIRKHDYGTT